MFCELLTKILGRSSQFYEIQIRGWPRVVFHVFKTSAIRKWELISFWADVAVIVWGFCNLELEALRFSVAVDGVDVVGSEAVGVELVDFGVMVLKLDSSFVG